MDEAKKNQKAGKISEDALAGEEKAIQKLTDDHVKKVEEMLTAKEKDILSV